MQITNFRKVSTLKFTTDISRQTIDSRNEQNSKIKNFYFQDTTHSSKEKMVRDSR